MNTRSTTNRNNQTKNSALVSRGFVMTAVAAAVLNSAAFAQTNSSSGINRRAAEGEAQAPASVRRTTVSQASRAKASVRKVAKATPTQKSRKAATPRSVKVVIRGNRNDARAARQQGMQSLQSANAAVAARNAEKAAAEAEARANAEALASQQNTFQQPYMYGYVPGGLNNPIASYGAGAYNSVPTTPGVIVGATPYGAPNLSFPSYYNTYNPGVFSTYSNFGSFNPYGF